MKPSPHPLKRIDVDADEVSEKNHSRSRVDFTTVVKTGRVARVTKVWGNEPTE